MEEILSSIKRIIAEDKAIDIDRPARKPAAKTTRAKPEAGVEETLEDDNILELTEEISEEQVTANGIFGEQRAPNESRLIDDRKLDSMRESLAALVAIDNANSPVPVKQSTGTSLEDMTRELMRPMLKEWLDENLPKLVEEMVAREIQRISQK